MRHLSAEDFQSEVKFYMEKFCTKMGGSSVPTMNGWIKGINYGPEFEKAVKEALKPFTFRKKMGGVTCVFISDRFWDYYQNS
jgi:hypothetical protein